ncbi:MAG TPA: ABC transporter ATP-binding protein [Candidatus Scatovicinus merdipullorum]|nr:ABC transporter ATP-binding protein [Candidatus Scatovicinus merdipullorum]
MKRARFIWTLIRPEKFWFLLYMLVVIPEWVASVAGPYLLGQMVDGFIYDKDISAFFGKVLLYAVVFLLQLLFNMLQLFVLNYICKQVKTRVHTMMFKRVLRFQADVLSDMKTGDYLDRIESADYIVRFLILNIVWVIGPVIKVAATVYVLSTINLYIALAFFVLIPLTVFISRLYIRKIAVLQQEYHKSQGVFTAWTMEIIKGMQEIKLMAAGTRMLKQFVGKLIKLFRLKIDSDKMEIKNEWLNAGVQLGSTLVLYIVSAFMTIINLFTIGGFITCLLYYNDAITIMNKVVKKIFEFPQFYAKVDRLAELYGQPVEDETGTELQIDNGEICFENVAFAYDRSKPVLSGFSLHIRPKEKIAVVGRSGVGKSTMIHLLLRFYQQQEGNIYIDGQNLNDCSLESIRKNIGIVHQDVILFNDSLRENFSCVKKDITDQEIWEVLQKVDLKDFVQGLPDQLDTVLGENDMDFSGGQKQRLSIARAFVMKPEILIFDEATSSLDYQTEQIVKESWEELSQGRTMIIIAHRLSTIINADRIAVIDQGKVAACAPHAELLNSCSIYCDLYQEQNNPGRIISKI